MAARTLFPAILAGLLAMQAPIGQAQNSNGFTFKRVKVKKAETGNRINIQISPEEDYYKNQHKKKQGITVGQETKTAALPKPQIDSYDWFWKEVSPELAQASSGRLHDALQKLQKDPAKLAKLAPGIAHFQDLVDKYGTNILMASLGKSVSPAFVLAVIGVESSGRPAAISNAGAVGLMQLVPETAKRFNVTDSTDAQQNINGGTAYLDWLLKEFKRDPLLALAGYNAGENAVKKHGGVPPFPETRAYVPKVVAAWQVARALCMTPPIYVTDGCVFRPRKKK
jgi:hypothetical protein